MTPRARPAKAPRSLAPSAAASRGSARAWVVLSVLALAASLAYGNALDNPFVIDDEPAITRNPQILTLSPLSVPLSPPDETAVARRPLVNLSLALNVAVTGMAVEGFRAVNVALLVVCAAVLFGLVRRTLRLPLLRPSFGAQADLLAAAAAVLWMLHPLNTEVVNYLSQRTQSMMGLCYLLTLYANVRWIETRRTPWAVAAVAACAAGMACKESMVTAPVLVVLFDRVFAFPAWRAAWAHRSVFYIALAATWGPLVLLMMNGQRTTVGLDAGVSPWSYLLNQAPIVRRYLQLVVWPVGLVVDYGRPAALALRDVALDAALVLGAFGGSVVLLWRAPAAGFLLFSVFVLLAPTSTVVPIASEVGAERRMFLPLASLVVLLVCAVYRGATWAAARGVLRLAGVWPWGRSAAAAAVVMVAVWFGLAVRERNAEYGSPLTLAETTVERRPHGRAHFALGVERLRAGRRAEAMDGLRLAASDFAPAHFALGTELIADRRYAEAARELAAFVDAMPSHAAAVAAYQQLGAALLVEGRAAEALAALERALERDGSSPATMVLMGQTLLQLARPADALPYLQRAVARQAWNAVAVDTLGVALAQLGRLEDAAAHFKRALSVNPDYGPARDHLARLEPAESTETTASPP